ncbi:hypothetical protein M0R45_006588 [Rubus argutus]|uniref:Uncharacterized protein n=1 Tax=Rubus argutus TaxID=59490 RepID=A0AAW1YRG0_RUBAR
MKLIKQFNSQITQSINPKFIDAKDSCNLLCPAIPSTGWVWFLRHFCPQAATAPISPCSCLCSPLPPCSLHSRVKAQHDAKQVLIPPSFSLPVPSLPVIPSIDPQPPLSPCSSQNRRRRFLSSCCTTIFSSPQSPLCPLADSCVQNGSFCSLLRCAQPAHHRLHPPAPRPPICHDPSHTGVPICRHLCCQTQSPTPLFLYLHHSDDVIPSSFKFSHRRRICHGLISPLFQFLHTCRALSLALK